MKLLQLNVTANWGSTGRIAEGIATAARGRGWETAIAFGRKENLGTTPAWKVGTVADVYRHYALHRLLDKEGLGSAASTKRLIESIRDYAPDIIHLHNIHDHWLNLPLLFDFLATLDCPVVWTLHDCWPFTGGCTHFVEWDCRQWQTQCVRCPYPKRKLRREKANHQLKIEKIKRLGCRVSLISVSSWLDSLVGESPLASLRHGIIHNGVDTAAFYPGEAGELRAAYSLAGKKVLLGVASTWLESKGLSDYIRLGRLLDDTYRIVLIGSMPKRMASRLPRNVVAIDAIRNVEDLARWYSLADAVLSLSKAETFGLTLAEGLACGTPAICYDNTALSETVDESVGLKVPDGDVSRLLEAVKAVGEKEISFPAEKCRDFVVRNFDKESQYVKYLDLYESLINNHTK